MRPSWRCRSGLAKSLTDLGVDISGSTPEAFARYITAEI
jgi:hypothetical protein